METQWRIQLLGGLRAEHGDRAVTHFRTQNTGALLAYLAYYPQRAHLRDELLDLLWPEADPDAARTSLRQALFLLRQQLEPPGVPAGSVLVADRTAVRLNPEVVSTDVAEFEVALHAAEAAGSPIARAEWLARAVELYRGELLPGYYEEWVLQERGWLAERFFQALGQRIALLEQAGDLTRALQAAQRGVSLDPLREEAHDHLIRLYAAAGQPAAALRQYGELERRLQEELGTTPSAATGVLAREIERSLALRSKPFAVSPDLALQLAALEAASPPPPLAPAPLLPSGTVTFLFTDIEASTRLWEEHPEAMGEALVRHDALVRQAIESAGGVVFKTFGDQFCAAFACVPEALRAALEVQRRLRAQEWSEEGGLRVRVALHTGPAQERAGDYFGPTLNRLARLLQAGHGGQILLSRAAQEVAQDHLPEGARLEDLGEHRLPDLARPEQISQLASPGLPADFPPLKTLETRRNNLPAQLTPLLGREQEVAAAHELLQEEGVRLVTLTGPGGVGKTRLALQVAAELLDTFADGVCFVNLAPISDPGLVASTIAQTLGVWATGGRPLLESLKDHLREKQLLLLLDNFEQVIVAAPLAAELLEAAPRLKVLVTSRAVLRLRGEKEFPVAPLALPDPKRLPPVEALSRYAAVTLFIQRALDVSPGFAVTHENAPVVVEICHRLDGLPLAIELAARRIKLLRPQALLARLESRLRPLTGGARDLPARQQTLLGCVRWSYDLLAEGEKTLFWRLSIFVGGCTLEAVEAVCNAEGDLEIDVLEGVASLVDKSLLRQVTPEQGDGDPRFLMLETIREYGLECLAASGEGETLRRWHAAHYLALAELAEPELRGPRQVAWLDRLEMEHDNLRAALAWSQAAVDRGELGLRAAGSLFWFWRPRGYWSEGRRWLEGALARAGARGLPGPRTAGRAKALFGAGGLALRQGDYSAARGWLEESVAIWRSLGDKRGVAYSLHWLGEGARDQGDDAAARSFFEESSPLFREVGEKWGLAISLYNLGLLASRRGDDAAARSLSEESLALFREVGEKWGLAFSLNGLGLVALRQGDDREARLRLEESLAIRRAVGEKRGIALSIHGLGCVAKYQGDYQRATAFFEESLALFWELGDRWGVALCLAGLAGVGAVAGQPERAARLCGAAEALREAIGALMSHSDRAYYERRVAALRAALGEAAFAAAWAAGRAMPLEHAIAFALQEKSEPT